MTANANQDGETAAVTAAEVIASSIGQACAVIKAATPEAELAKQLGVKPIEHVIAPRPPNHHTRFLGTSKMLSLDKRKMVLDVGLLLDAVAELQDRVLRNDLTIKAQAAMIKDLTNAIGATLTTPAAQNTAPSPAGKKPGSKKQTSSRKPRGVDPADGPQHTDVHGE